MRLLLPALILACLLSVSAGADSLFSRTAAERGSMISDKKAQFEVGDIITVLIRENVDASTQANTDTKKESTLDAQAAAADNPFLVADGPGGMNIMPAERLPNWGIEIENEHKGSGKTKRSNKLVTTISCTVTEVLDDKNVAIEGQKRVTVNREDSKLFLSGTIRASDVSTANTIASDKVANAVISLQGQGPLWNNQRRGLITRLLDWFSPF